MSVDTIDQPDREQVVAAVEAVAFDEGKECEHCDGTGRTKGGRRVVHSYRGPFGADWDAEGVIELVRASRHVRWGSGFNGHDLAVLEDNGKWVLFQVPHPQREATP